MKKCHFCAEEIQDEAVKCRYCGEFLKETNHKQTTSTEKSQDEGILKNKISFIKNVFAPNAMSNIVNTYTQKGSIKKVENKTNEKLELHYFPFIKFTLQTDVSWSGTYSETHYKPKTEVGYLPDYTSPLAGGSGLKQTRVITSEPYNINKPTNGSYKNSHVVYYPMNEEYFKLKDIANFMPVFNNAETIKYDSEFEGTKKSIPFKTDADSLLQVKNRVFEIVQDRENSKSLSFAQQLSNVHVQYNNVNFSFVYFPIWIYSFEFNSKPFFYLIDGVNGSLAQEKKTITKIFGYFSLLFVIPLLLVSLGITVLLFSVAIQQKLELSTLIVNLVIMLAFAGLSWMCIKHIISVFKSNTNLKGK